MNSLNRAGAHALSAVCTEIIIDRGMEVIDPDRTVRALLFADLTAYAAVFAT